MRRREISGAKQSSELSNIPEQNQTEQNQKDQSQTEQEQTNLNSEKPTLFNKKRKVTDPKKKTEPKKKELSKWEELQKKKADEEKKNINAYNDRREEYCQDLVNFEKTVYGMIKTKDGRYLKIVEIEPITFLLRPQAEQDAIIMQFYQWLKIAPRKMQFITTTTYTDASEIVTKLKYMLKDETNKLVLERRDELIRHIKKMASTEALSKKFYIVYQYEGTERGDTIESEQEIYYEMETIYNTLVSHFNGMGNSIVEHENESVFDGEILYKMMNPKSSKTEPFLDRMSRIVSDNLFSEFGEKDIQKISESNYISPRGIDLRHSNYNVVDGTFQTYLYVRRNGYRARVTAGWFDMLTSFGEGVTVNMYTEKKDRSSTITNVGRAMRMRISEAHDKGRAVEDADGLLNEAENARFIRTSMAENSEDLYDVCIMLTVNADTLKELRKRVRHIKEELAAKDILVSDTSMHMEEGFRMALPLLDIQPAIFKKAKRNFLTSSLASTYMWTAFEILDTEGVVLGVNGTNGSLVSCDLFNSNKYSNANMVALGTSGSGKSFLLMSLAYTMRLTGKQVFVVLPEKGYEWRQLTNAIGGSFIELAPGSRDCINIMAIRPKIKADASLTADGIEDNTSLLSDKIHQVITFLQLNRTQDLMTDEEEAEISTVLTGLYKEFGINMNNDSIWANKEHTILKKMPVLGDFYEKTKENPVLKTRISVILKAYVLGDSKNMNRQTNVDLNNKFVVISVSKADRKLAPYSFIAIDCCYDTIKADRETNKVMILDELWKLMVNPYASEYVMNIYKIIRGYGAGCLSATQNLSDLSRSDNGGAVINNAKLKFILGMEKQEANSLQEIMDISASEKQIITRQKRGSAMFCANDDKVPIIVKSPDEWLPLFTTDSKTLQRLKAEREADQSESDEG